jgi:hypothetical protein
MNLKLCRRKRPWPDLLSRHITEWTEKHIVPQCRQSVSLPRFKPRIAQMHVRIATSWLIFSSDSKTVQSGSNWPAFWRNVLTRPEDGASLLTTRLHGVTYCRKNLKALLNWRRLPTKHLFSVAPFRMFMVNIAWCAQDVDHYSEVNCWPWHYGC